jgi:hypothetical protein
LRAIPLLLFFGLALPALASDHTPPPVQPATTFAAVEVHADEKVAIAAEPYDTKEKEVHLPRRLSQPRRNAGAADRDQQRRPAHLLRDARILFQTAAGEKNPGRRAGGCGAADDAQGARGRKIPMPGPLPKIKLKPKASNKDIEQDFDTFEYGALVVEPHTTRAGFLFYDVSELSHPLRGRQAAPARAARCRWQRAVLLRDSLRQVPEVQVRPDELSRPVAYS